MNDIPELEIIAARIEIVRKFRQKIEAALEIVNTTKNTEVALDAMWNLAFVDLRELESYRPGGGFSLNRQ